MGQWLLILWLVGSVLACPFQCMGVFAHEQSDSAATIIEQHCECCPHQRQDSDAPPLPISDEECCDCICDGAVLTSQQSLGLADLSSSVALTIVDADSIVSSQLIGPSLAWDTAASSGKPGRALRLAMRSLQV